MPRFRKYIAVLFLLLAFARPAHSQFYAPDTEYHDIAQRVYVVEAARVLAWLHNAAGGRVAEVRFTVTNRNDEVQWMVEWLDAAGKSQRSSTVSYATDLLKSGPEFYRQTFRQLTNLSAIKLLALAGNKARALYWAGASQMTPSREEALTVALRLAAKSKPTTAEWIPELAGLMAHAALPGISRRVTLDSMLLGRAAAWLALTELVSGVELAELWAPILFQTARENLALEAWRKAPGAAAAQQSSQQAGWGVWLGSSRSTDLFRFASAPGNLPMGMAMLAQDEYVNDTGSVLADVFHDLATTPEEMARYHNYINFFSIWTSVGGGHISQGIWPVYGRVAWANLLASHVPGSGDYTGHVAAMKTLKKALSTEPATDESKDASLLGFSDFVPIYNMAYQEGIGPLAPAAVATSRDLLNYGWEIGGASMASRYYFVARRWGAPEQSKPIFQACLGSVPGWTPLFRGQKTESIPNYAKDLRRLEMMDTVFALYGINASGEKIGPRNSEDARWLAQRFWLRPHLVRAQVNYFLETETQAEIPGFLHAFLSEGGAFANTLALACLNSLSIRNQDIIPDFEKMRRSMAEALPQPNDAYARAIFERRLSGLSDFERGQAYEKMYWQNQESKLESKVFAAYMLAGAYDSAKRFYRQSRSNYSDTVRFSHSAAQFYMAAWALDDPEMRQWALEDSESGSAADMELNILDCAVRGSPAAFADKVQEISERYNPEGYKTYKGFAPLYAAFFNSKHPMHEEALRFLATPQRSSGTVILRWILIQRHKLPKEKALIALGGEQGAGLFSAVLVRYLENDVEGMEKAVSRFLQRQKESDEHSVLAAILLRKLKNLPPLPDEDLKPADALSIRQIVQQSKEGRSAKPQR